MPSVVLRLRLCALPRQPKAASSRSCAATPSGCADAAREVFPSQRHFQPSDLAFGAFDHLFPPNQMISANHTFPQEDNSLPRSVHATASASIQSAMEAVLVEQMAAEKLARGLEMQRLEMRLTNIEHMLEQIIQAKNAACAAQERTVAPPVSLPTLPPTNHRHRRHHHR